MSQQGVIDKRLLKKKEGLGSIWKDNSYAIVSLVLFVVLWELLVRLLDIPRYLLPTPSVILATSIERFSTLVSHTWVTLYEVLLGFGIGVLVGVPLAITIVYIPVVRKTLYVLLVSAQSVPKVALAPLLVAWFGYALIPKLIVAFLICFFVIIINTVVGLESISREMIYLARSLGATGGQQFWKFRLPKALPSTFAGLKVGITLAVVGAVVGEYVAADKGLGYMQIVAGGNLDTPLVFAILIILSLMGIVLFYVTDLIESLVIKGSPNGAKGRRYGRQG